MKRREFFKLAITAVCSLVLPSTVKAATTIKKTQPFLTDRADWKARHVYLTRPESLVFQAIQELGLDKKYKVYAQYSVGKERFDFAIPSIGYAINVDQQFEDYRGGEFAQTTYKASYGYILDTFLNDIKDIVSIKNVIISSMHIVALQQEHKLTLYNNSTMMFRHH
jgi:hypothetical protein